MRYKLKNMPKEIGICRRCDAYIWWGYRYGRPFPYDVGFEKDGTPYRRKPHKETCPYASDYQPQSRRNMRDRADAHTEAVRRWKQSCEPDTEHLPLDWTTLTIYDVPEKHAARLAWKLVERGGPFARWHPQDIFSHLHGIAIEEKRVVAILIRPALFNFIHHHLHGFMMSVFGEMSERKPVWVAGYRLEPSCVLQACNLVELQHCDPTVLQHCHAAASQHPK